MRLLGFIGVAAFAVVTVACGGQTDAGITTSIKTQLAADDTVEANNINVTTREHVVTLTGNVDSLAEEARAIEIARTAEGVTDVIDQLEVRETAATTGVRVDGDRDGLDALGNAIKEGAEATGDAAVRAGKGVRDAVTDDDRDSDNDGK